MKDLTKGNSGRLIIEFAIPICIGSIFQLFYSLVDTRIVGQTLGDAALAAVGATSTMNNLIIGFLSGLTSGFSVWVARDFGAHKEDEMRKDIAATLVLGSIIGFVLTLLSVSFLTQILGWINIPTDLMADGMNYVRIILMGMMITMLYNLCANVLRAIGDTITPLCFLIVSTLANIGLDYYFILRLHQGVKGAAYATVIAQGFSVVMCLIYIWRKYPILHLSPTDFKLKASRIQTLLASGISMGLMNSLVSIGTVTLQGAINQLGTLTIVAHTGARKLTEVLMMPFGAISTTMATYCSQNLGAKQYKRIKEGIHKGVWMSWIWCGMVVLISYTIAPQLIQIITATQSQEVIDTASLYLKIDTLFYFVVVVVCIYRNALQGLGDHMTPIISSAIELVGKVLVVIFLTPRLHYMGVIWAEPIVWILMVIPLIIKMFTFPILKNAQYEQTS